jgi:iron complex transport system substrate-binding protein
MVIKVLVRDRARFTAPVMGRRGVLAVFAGLVAACSSTPPPRAGGRIVGLGNPVTETLYALGVGERVVGADLSSQHPAAAAALPKVGYYRQFSAEGVLSLAPDLVLASDGAGPAVALERVRGAGVVVQVLALADDLAGARANVRAIAAAVDRVEEGERLIAAHRRHSRRGSRRWWRRTTTRPRALFVYARGPGMRPWSPASSTPAAELLRLAGGRQRGRRGRANSSRSPRRP